MIECSICKSGNHDTAVFCADCGQRLQPGPNFNTNKLHSPLLDSHEMEPQMPASDQPFPGLPGRPPIQPIRPGSTSQNDLHSPLLDAWNTRPLNENPGSQHAKSKPAPDLLSELSAGLSTAIPSQSQSIVNNKSSRLHSPVLDGPAGLNRGFEPEDLDMPVEEYNSLRSPLLAAKVPLPETPTPPAGPSITSPVNTAPDSHNQPTIPSLFGSNAQPSVEEQSYNQFATSLFDPTPAQTGDRPIMRSPKQTGRFTKVSGLGKDEKIDNSFSSIVSNDKKSQLPGIHSLEQKGLEPAPSFEAQQSGVFKILACLFLLASLVFKFWYWQVLGAALWSSQAFLFDQIGQIVVVLLLLSLIFKAKV